jgi:hypothetical protein
MANKRFYFIQEGRKQLLEVISDNPIDAQLKLAKHFGYDPVHSSGTIDSTIYLERLGVTGPWNIETI